MNNVYLALGSNRGDREVNLLNAIKLLNEKSGRVVLSSSMYETQPWKMKDDTNFLNLVVLLETQLSAFDLMASILSIEESMGRTREKTAGYEPRTIDIDILFFNNDIMQFESLIIPHPQIPNRRFVLEPLSEIAPNYIHPALKKTINQLLSDSPDRHSIAKFVSK